MTATTTTTTMRAVVRDHYGSADVLRVAPASALVGEISPPGDKSVSHRAVLFGALADGAVDVDGFGAGADTRSTIAAVEQLGARVELLDDRPTRLRVHGVGLRGLRAPEGPIEMRVTADDHVVNLAVSDRACHLFTMLGVAGVGKSRLAAEFLREVDATVGTDERPDLHGVQDRPAADEVDMQADLEPALGAREGGTLLAVRKGDEQRRGANDAVPMRVEHAPGHPGRDAEIVSRDDDRVQESATWVARSAGIGN